LAPAHRWSYLARPLGLALSVVIVASAATGGWLASRRASMHPVAVTATATKAAGNAPALAAPDPAPSPDPHTALREGSLRGSAPDGDIHLGFGGHLQPDLALRRLFDYYLAMTGELKLDGIRQLLREDLQRRAASPPLIDEVMQVFERYVNYQQALGTLTQQAALSLPDLLKQKDALRERLLGKDLAAAFFADDRLREQQLLQRLAIIADPNLSADEKTRRLRALEASQPEAQHARQQAMTAVDIQTQTAQFDADGTDEATRYTQRAAMWGDDAATRLQALDAQRAQWQARLNDYTRESQRIRTDSSLDAAQRQAALEQLLQQKFQGPEQLQARSMEQAGLLGR
jgi:lipase chaperone LimK